MIDINLIPLTLRKKGKGSESALKINIPNEILIGVGVGLALLLLTIHVILGVIWFIGEGRLSHANAEWQKVLPDKKILDDINGQSVDLKKKFKMMSDMTTKNGILWAPKFNAISDALPRGLWIRKMGLDRIALTMEGSVVSKSQNEINNVGLFLSTLKQNEIFIDDFSSLEVNSIQRGRNNSIDVTDFTVTAKLK
jgi:hypothetical protein